MSRIVEVLVPARLGTGFRWLLASSWTSNLGDGIALAAGPLLVASLTRDPLLVSLAATVQWASPLVFGLVAGVLTDRLDRRLIVVGVDLARAAVLTVLTVAVATGAVPGHASGQVGRPGWTFGLVAGWGCTWNVRRRRNRRTPSSGRARVRSS